jgi:hypothetical protein
MPIRDESYGTSDAPRRTHARRRPFSLSDAMILVATAAAILAINKWVSVFYRQHIFQGTSRQFVESVLDAIVLSATTLWLRLRRPRPRVVAVFRQRGAVACAVAVVIPLLLGLLVGIAVLLQTELVRFGVVAGRLPASPWRQASGFSLFRFNCWSGGCSAPIFYTLNDGIRPHYAALFLLTGAVTGAAVTGAWLMLAISGRRCPEPGWLDRSGRILGAFWVLNFWVLAGAFLTSLF